MNAWLVAVAVAVLAVIGLGVVLLVLVRAGRRATTADEQSPLELLHVEFEPTTRELRVRLAGRQLAHVDDVPNVELREAMRRLLFLLTPAPNETRAATPSEAPAPPAAADDLNAPFLTRLWDSLTRQRGYAPATPRTSAKGKAMDSQASETKRVSDMFAQVNAILQEKLHALPDAPPVLIVGESGELHIRMGAQTYLQIDAVPNEHIRALIQASVAEWEAGQL